MADNPLDLTFNRRGFLGQTGVGLGTIALTSLLGGSRAEAGSGVLHAPHHPSRAMRVISLFMSGGPSQHDLFDHKPLLNQRNGEDLPASVRMGQRLTGMSVSQARFPLAGSAIRFAQHGQSGAWLSELLPWTARIADELCFIKSVGTEAINHDPAITFWQTDSQLAGRPSLGAWLSYGLGSVNANLPGFVVLVSKDRIDQPLYARLWGNGFLPSSHQGVQFRSGKDPVLHLANPAGISPQARRGMLDRLAELNTLEFQGEGDPEIHARIDQYELAFRMQASVPEALDLAGEPVLTFDLYGPEERTPDTFAANCLLARRLAEREVWFVQLYHPGWDHHGGLPKGIRRQALDVDHASYALVTDLKQRGLLAYILVVWGGEFGRTSYSQGKLTSGDYGRDHHPRCCTTGWRAVASSRRSATGPPTTLATMWSRTRSTSTMSRPRSCTCSGSTTNA